MSSLDSKCGKYDGKSGVPGKEIGAVKSATHYANYHYPSGSGTKSPIKGGKGVDQHTTTKGINYFDVSK